jgi:TRAP-type transport system periplasmic protein
VIELPFVAEEARSGSAALWELHKTGSLGGEYDDFHVLALFTDNGALIHTVNKPVRRLNDLKSMRVRTPSPAVSALLEYLGASPIGMPPTAIYQGLAKGALDGVATTWDLVGPMHLNELLKYHTEARLYTAAFYIVMNKDKYASLSAEVQEAIDATTGDNMQPMFAPLWDKWDAAGRQDAVRRGNQIMTIDDATRETWQAELQPMIAQYLEGLGDEGIADPKRLYETALEFVAKHSA